MSLSTPTLTVFAALCLATFGCKSPEKSAPADAPKTAEASKKTADAPKKTAEAPKKTADAPKKKAEAPKPTAAQTPPAAKPPARVQYAGAHILVAYKGAQRAKPTITRTKEEALARAGEARTKAMAPGADFAKLAGELSDGPSAKRGGSLGTWVKGRMVPEFDKAIETLEIGGVSEPVETGFGYHIIRRDALPEMRAGAHILVAYKGAQRAKPAITRSKEEAAARAKDLTTQARANPAGFADLAKANSDGPSAVRGGSLGTWARGRMVPEFDKAIDTMKVSDISDPVETPFGFHVIQRHAAP
jgi:peptidyl-prolyl cis-trans isomerase NIMA-interacting 1